MQINFGGFNPQQQEINDICAKHFRCKDCPYYNLQGIDGIICENAIWRINNEPRKSDTT